jgi:acyl carrier protein
MNDAANSPTTPLRPRLIALVKEILDRGAEQAVPPDASLSELGMSSIKMVNLMLAVEGEFDLSIPQTEITPDNFRSVNSIEALLQRLMGLKP